MKENGEGKDLHYFHNHEATAAPKRRNLCYGIQYLNERLVESFYTFGYQVALRPRYFIIIPFIISCVFSTGLLFIQFEDNPVRLFIPYEAPFMKEQRIIENTFKMNYSNNFDPMRFTRHEGHSRIIITAKDNKTILRSVLWPEIMELEEKIRNISIIGLNGQEQNYNDICAKFRGRCAENPALNLNEIIGELENGTTFINYPIMIVPFVVPQVLGGITVNKSADRIEDVKSILLMYFLQIQTDEEVEIGYAWELKVLKFLHSYKSDNIDVSYYASRSLGEELKEKMDSCIPYIPLTGFIMTVTCMALLWMSDCIKSKPLIGLVGIISACMAAGTAFGLLIYCGTTYTRLNIVALFLVLGIGVDDIFVAIAAWQKTSIRDSVPKRLAQTYSDAAVSVTITSLTNALSFAVGTTTPTLIVQSFCLYCGITVIFAYLWFITFCGGFLALAGYMEEQGRHSIFLIKVKPQNENGKKSKFLSFLFASQSLQEKNSGLPEQKHPHVVSVFFRDYVGSLLCNTKFKWCVLVSVILYFVGATYGCVILKEGLYRHRMARDDSYLVKFAHVDHAYYRHLPYSVQVVITGNVTYSDPATQKKLMELEEKFEQLPHGADPLYTLSWLRSFLKRLRRLKSWREQITDEKSFIKVLREKYLVKPENTLNMDVVFNEDYSRIVASRTILQTANVKDIYDDVVMMNNFRKVAEESEFNVTCFHLLFSIFDQHNMIRPLTIQSIVIAVALVVLVALLFIPDAWGSVAIAFAIVSIAVGVLGYMAFWDINLDHVSAGSLFMCIGFSVDFSAHITYTYLSSKKKTSEEKIRESMLSLGLPIVQGGLTTVLSLVTFLLIPGYGYRTFFKTIFMVTIFAAYHSIILIPLFLATVEDLCLKYKKDKYKISSSETKTNSENGTNGSYKPSRNGSAKIHNNSINNKRSNGQIEAHLEAIEHPRSPEDSNENKSLNNASANSKSANSERPSSGRDNTNHSVKVDSVKEGLDNEAYTADEGK